MDLTNLNLNKDRNKMRRKPAVDLSTMVYGKIPPQAKELEEAVLGAIMLGKERIRHSSRDPETGMFLPGGTPADIPHHAKPGAKKPAH